jgi:hypothetical protein
MFRPNRIVIRCKNNKTDHMQCDVDNIHVHSCTKSQTSSLYFLVSALDFVRIVGLEFPVHFTFAYLGKTCFLRHVRLKFISALHMSTYLTMFR